MCKIDLTLPLWQRKPSQSRTSATLTVCLAQGNTDSIQNGRFGATDTQQRTRAGGRHLLLTEGNAVSTPCSISPTASEGSPRSENAGYAFTNIFVVGTKAIHRVEKSGGMAFTRDHSSSCTLKVYLDAGSLSTFL